MSEKIWDTTGRIGQFVSNMSAKISHIDREQMCRIALEGIKIPLNELSADRCDGLEASVGHGHIIYA